MDKGGLVASIQNKSTTKYWSGKKAMNMNFMLVYNNYIS